MFQEETLQAIHRWLTKRHSKSLQEMHSRVDELLKMIPWRIKPPRDDHGNITGHVHKVKLGGLSLFIIINTNDHGEVVELFNYERTGHQGEIDGIAGLVNIALQHGTPLRPIVKFLLNRKYEPQGIAGQPKSISDAIGRMLNEHLPKEERFTVI